MRGQGRLYRQHGSTHWWLDFSVHGTRHRESSGTTSQKEAQRVLRQKIGDRETGKVVGRPERVMLAEYVTGEDGKERLVGGLRHLVERQYVLDGRRSLDRVQLSLNHLERIIGRDTPAMQIDLDGYAETRLTEGAARATVNQELAALRRGFRLAVKKHLLTVLPVFDLPKVHNERRGFFEEGDFLALELELPAYLRPVIVFARLTGWRVHKEVVALTWDTVDWDGQVIRLAAADTKGGEARTWPFRQAPALKAVLEAQWAARDGVMVFHRHGRPIKDFRAAWDNACKRAGLAGRIPHDLRRSAARDLRRAGVSEGEIMKLCGWRTRSMFDRYNIIDEQDLAAAVAKRFAPAPEPATA